MKKNDKIVILVIIGMIMCVLSWVVSTGAFDSGKFVATELTKAGIFDYFLVLYYSFYYKCSEIFYLIVLGGTYGVLSQTKSYRKLVSKTASLISKKEIIAMCVVTLLMGIWVSFVNTILPTLIFVPFIITVFLKRGKDKLTAASAGLGGYFIGLIGQTVGTYGLVQFSDLVGITVKDGIGAKIAMFVVAYILFNLFAILHMKKNNKLVNDTKSDPFTTEKLDESNKAKKTHVWPIAVIFIVTFIVSVLAYISWDTSFGVSAIQDGYTKIKDGVLMDVLGSFNAFGYWSDTLPMAFILLTIAIIVSLIDRVNINDFMGNFADGIRKSGKAILGYVFALSIFIVSYFFDWPIALLSFILNDGTFNVISIVVLGICAAFFYVDPDYVGYQLGTHLSIVHASSITKSIVMLKMSMGLATVFVPSSAILIYILSYLDIPYKEWIKYIWKFVLATAIAIIVIGSILL